MTFDNKSDKELWELVEVLKRDFQERDILWDSRRKIRFRRQENDLLSLPLNPTISDTALLVYQSETPNQETHLRVKRLNANAVRFELVMFSSEPEDQSLGQGLEIGIKALYKWGTQGKLPFDKHATRFQQGDGLGIFKIDFIPGHGKVLKDFDIDDLKIGGKSDADIRFTEEFDRTPEDSPNREGEAYATLTDKLLQAEKPPIRFSAPDPRTCYWWEDGDGISLIAEEGKKLLNPLLSAFKEDYGLRIVDNRLILNKDGSEAVSDQTFPGNENTNNLADEVRYVELRSRTEIAILIEHPKIKNVRGRPRKSTLTDKGVILTFKNPFGPFTTGYALVEGDVTTDASPADKYQPPILASLIEAQIGNVLTTVRVNAAVEEALAPPYIKVSPETPMAPVDEDKSPTVTEGREITMVPGEIKRVESPHADLDKADSRISEEAAPYKFQDALMGEATADTSGHRLALQVGQADLQLAPYQEARAKALVEIMKGVVYAIKAHGLTVYIPTIPDSAVRTGNKLRVIDQAKITPEMAGLQFELIVTLGAETALSRYAKWQALDQRHQQGTLSFQSLMEQSDVENPEDEIARVFEGKLFLNVMQAIIPAIAQAAVVHVQQKFAQGPEGGQITGPAEQTIVGPDADTGLVGGGGSPGNRAQDSPVRLPGVGLNPAGPSVTTEGPPVPSAA